MVKPIAEGYIKLVPEPGRNGIRHFLDNINEPIVFGNTLLQGRFEDAGTTAARFIVNSTVGVAGFADVAKDHKLKKKIGDFGQTLWAWGVPDGPYIILPVLGPDAVKVSPRVGHLHVTVDDLPWHWGDFSNDNSTIVVVGMPPGPHKVMIELADPEHRILAGQRVTFTVPGTAK